MFGRHTMDIRMNTEFKGRLTPRDDKTIHSQNLAMSIVELALMHKYWIITVLPFSNYAGPIFAQRTPNGKLRLFVDLKKINTLIANDYTKNNHPVSTLSDAAQHQAGKSLLCKLDCSQVYYCLQIADQRSVEMLVSILLAELLPTGDLQKVLADRCLLSRVSCASVWTQLSKSTNVLNTWMILVMQPKMLRTLPRTFGQSSSAFAMRD